MKLMIKNMVCPRCIDAVTQTFERHDIIPLKVSLGEVHLNTPLSEEKRSELMTALNLQGFEIIDDRNSEIISRIKGLIIEQIHHTKENLKTNWSDFVSGHLHLEYKYLSRLFSAKEGITIEQYIIQQKIEKVKELIKYDQLSLSQIAMELNYSSVAHLSGQFKKVTGMSPSQFKSMGARTGIDM